MPPRTGVTCPSSEVPAPQGTTGTPCGVAQRQQACGFLRGFDEGDRVGQHRRLGVLAVRVVLAQAGVGGDASPRKSRAASMTVSTGMACRVLSVLLADWPVGPRLASHVRSDRLAG